MPYIRSSWSTGEVIATLFDTRTARQLVEVLPISRNASTWGDEVYFPVPFTVEAEHDASNVVDVGAVCAWIEGNSLALLFGPTPISIDSECRLVSVANVVGKIVGDSQVLNAIKPGDLITVEAAELAETE